MTFGSHCERVVGPTLFDGLPDPELAPPTADAHPPPARKLHAESATPRRRGLTR
jgi:hypothetical protein